ncbi:hypothetical protein D3C78_1039050 [compost metagenome]
MPHLQGHGAIIGNDHLMPQVLQLLSKQNAVGRVIVHYQNPERNIRLVFHEFVGSDRLLHRIQRMQH